MKNFAYFILCLTFTAPAFAGVTVSSPSSGETVSSPFKLSADASSCSSQPVSAMAYSLDSGGDLYTVNATSIDTDVSTGTGSHTLHVKAWGDKGASCVTDVSIDVTALEPSVEGASAAAPSGAVSVSSIQAFSGWSAIHDGGGSGSASGGTSLVGSPSYDGTAREFYTKYSDAGDERFSKTFADDTTATNFLYDGWVYLTSSAGNIANLEMDVSQTMPNGQTVIFGFQCDGYSSTWDYTENAGTPTHPSPHWIHSYAHCNPRSWGRNAWHHVQIEYYRSDTGVVTYQAVWLDGVKSTLNATVHSAFALGWGPIISTNLEIDGLGSSGSATVYLDDLKVYRW
jgi:hypothetical protein